MTTSCTFPVWRMTPKGKSCRRLWQNEVDAAGARQDLDDLRPLLKDQADQRSALAGRSREQIACFDWEVERQLPLLRPFIDARVTEAQRLRAPQGAAA